ncbi:MAG: hypothetical protein QOC71_1380 [Thermoplasmata archaeon]|jgi:hypothetical protein|nr:hypothetical protein [Thermoplasmata archaeon]
MRCPHCGSVVEPARDTSGALFCPVCQNTGILPSGVPAPPPIPPLSPPAAVGSAPGKATAALVLGIATFVAFPIAIVLGPIALVLGIQALRKIKASPPGTPGQGMAVAGIVLGSVGILFGLTVVMAALVFVLVSNLGPSAAGGTEFTFVVDAAGPGGTLTLAAVTNATFADWSDYELGGDARCTLPSGPVEAGDRIVCVTDGDVVLIDWGNEETVYSTTV